MNLPPTSRNAMRGVLRAVGPAMYQTAYRHSIVVCGAFGEAREGAYANDGYRCHWAKVEGWQGSPLALFPEAWMPGEGRMVKLFTLLGVNKRAEVTLDVEDDCHAVITKVEQGQVDTAFVNAWDEGTTELAYRESVLMCEALARAIPQGYEIAIGDLMGRIRDEDVFRLPGGTLNRRYAEDALRAMPTPTVHIGHATVGKSSLFAFRSFDKEGTLQARAIVRALA